MGVSFLLIYTIIINIINFINDFTPIFSKFHKIIIDFFQISNHSTINYKIIIQSLAIFSEKHYNI